jgi:hypothetical protein
MEFKHETHPLLGQQVIWTLHPELGKGKLTYASVEDNKGAVIYGDEQKDRTLPDNFHMEHIKLSEIQKA